MELKMQQLEQKVERNEGSSEDRVRELQARLESALAEKDEQQEELEAAEEEKYTLASDLEVLQEELEDANSHQKRYYEALMNKEEAMRQLRDQSAALQKVVERLQYENELKDMQNNPVQEDLGGAYEEEMGEMKRKQQAKDAELRSLKAELEGMQSTVDDEESFDQIHDGRHAMAVGGAATEGDAVAETHTRRAKQAVPAGNGELSAELERQRQQLMHADKARAQVQQRLDAAEARANASMAQVGQLQGQVRAQEAEIMKLIKAKDDVSSQHDSRDEEISELNDNYYEATSKLEEVEEEKRELQVETEKLRVQLQEARQQSQRHASALADVQHARDEAVEAQARAEKLLDAAIGQ